jgi:hypothetical protein
MKELTQDEFLDFVKTANKDTLEIVKLYVDSQNKEQYKHLVIDKLLSFFLVVSLLVVVYFGYISYLESNSKTHTKVEKEYIIKIVYKDKPLDKALPLDVEYFGFKKIFIQDRGKTVCTGYNLILFSIEHYYTYCVPNK